MNKSYEILPFNFDAFESEFVIVNDFGEYLYINPRDFYQFLSYELRLNSDIYKDLCSKFFACDAINNSIVDICATRYRAKFDYIFDSVSLFMIVVTHRCNQRCTYCHASSGNEHDGHEFDLDEESANNIVYSISKFNCKKIKIEFQGGEPTLNFKIIKHIVLQSKSVLDNKDVEFVICSNLYSINNEITTFVKEHNISISTSLDGDKLRHDKDRILSNGLGTFDNVLSNIQFLRTNGVGNVSALLTVTKNNINYLKQVIDTYIQLGFNSVFIRELNPYGKAKDNANLAYSIDKFIESYIAALDYIFLLNKNGYFFIEEFMAILARKILTPFSTGFVDLQSPSGYAINSIIFNTNGDVFVSDEARMLNRSHGEEYFKLGNAHDDDIAAWYGDECSSHVESSVLECIPKCSWCAYKPYCGVDPVRLKFNKNSVADQCTKHKKIFRYIFNVLLKDAYKIKTLRSWAYNSPLPIGVSE